MYWCMDKQICEFILCVCEVLCERNIVEFQVWCDELIDTMSCGSVVSYVIVELDSRRMEELVMPRILSQQ